MFDGGVGYVFDKVVVEIEWIGNSFIKIASNTSGSNNEWIDCNVDVSEHFLQLGNK